MICPHCKTTIHESFSQFSTGSRTDSEGYWTLFSMICPECEKIIIRLRKQDSKTYAVTLTVVYPKGTTRNPLPDEVPTEFSEDYIEACNVLNDSSKASAALSRRCLQNILREKAELRIFEEKTGKIKTTNIRKSSLNNEIQQVLDNGGLSTIIAEGLDAVRVIGNFAAHPIKSKSTGEIVPVEEGEAEWNLDILESLFDLYFVQPAILKEKRDKLNKKLEDAGKPPLK